MPAFAPHVHQRRCFVFTVKNLECVVKNGIGMLLRQLQYYSITITQSGK